MFKFYTHFVEDYSCKIKIDFHFSGIIGLSVILLRGSFDIENRLKTLE